MQTKTPKRTHGRFNRYTLMETTQPHKFVVSTATFSPLFHATCYEDPTQGKTAQA